jgi:hypothetical protein
MQDRTFGGGVSIQDTDLLVRLNAYFDHLEQRVEQGQGWLIFNSNRERGARILRLLLSRLDGYRPFVSLLHLPWRDFALHAYISTVALPRSASLVADEEEGSARKREFAIASGVANGTAFQLAHADLVILSSLNPAKLHETILLSQTAVERVARRRAIIALTEHDPWSLSDAFAAADPTGATWRHFYGAMRESSLIAI